MKFKRLALTSLFIIFVVGAAFAAWTYRELHTPVAHNHANDYIDVPRGSSTYGVLSQMTSQGVIGRSWPLALYLRITGHEARLQAGQYKFPSPITPLTVLRKLEEGQQRLNRFMVIEGWTRWDVAEAMARIPELDLDSTDSALQLMNETKLVKEIDLQATNLEGYIYPDTYNFPPKVTPQEMIATMVRRFKQVWEAESAKAAKKDLPPREALVVASLIETEAKLRAERPLIASVIYNRLQAGMPLGIDSTVIYAAKLAGKWRNDGKVYQSYLDSDSPYNTRKTRGLPPGPIASVGESSIHAALNPAQTDYLYYVRDPQRDDGAHNFYNNETDFARGVQALREWERTRNASQ